MGPFDFIAQSDLTIAAFFLIMGAIGFIVFRKEQITDELSEEDKLNVQKHKRIGYMFSSAQIVVGLYFILKHYEMLDGLFS